MLTLNTPLAIPDSVAFHPLGDGEQTVIVSMNSGYLFTGNRTTQTFLQAVDGQRTLGQIVDLLGEKYEVESARLSADLVALTQRLITEGLLEARDDGTGT